jgi:hypothetical protein
MEKIKKTILRERILEQLGKENVAVFKGLKREFPDVPDTVIQAMCATIMIACDKGTVYLPQDFESVIPDKVKEEMKLRDPTGSASPEQRKELEKLAAIHNTDPIAKELEAKAAYDEKEKRWHSCTCGNEDINKTSAQTGRSYQACGKCKIYLNADGLIKPFKKPEAGQGRIG